MVEKKSRTKKSSSAATSAEKEATAMTKAGSKSAASQDIPEAPMEAKVEGGASGLDAVEAGVQEEPKKAPRKRAGRKPSAAKKKAEAEEKDGESPAQEPEKKPRKRAPRKKTVKTDKGVSSEALAVPPAATEVAPARTDAEPAVAQPAGEAGVAGTSEAFSVPEAAPVPAAAPAEAGAEAVADVATPSPEEGVSDQDAPQAPVAAEGEKRKSGRSRRGRRSRKKTEETKAALPEPAKDADEVFRNRGEEEEVEFLEAEAEESEVEEPEEPVKEGPKPVRKLLINAEEPEECRLALLEDGRLESIYVSTVTRTHTKNNIYKAKIVALEANLQAAFVDYGTEKNGFLPFGEIHPEYYRQNVSEKTKKLIEQHQWKKLSITDVLEKGQEVLVQVVKEEIGTKGANMTTYLSLPGRCVVLLPGSDSSGISRKISGEEMRSQLRDIMESLSIPEGIGWIVRTASSDINKAALTRDVTYLLRLWGEVKKKGQDMEGVGLIYQDHDSVLRFLREHFDTSIEEILVDDLAALEQVKGFVELLPAKQRTVKIKLHRGSRPIFNQYSVEDQIESIYQPRVNLPSGGSIVIDQTEALVAIDVNSGSTSKGQNFEASIFQANMEAAAELARQLRLRDLGGLIVVDFIDMRLQKNIREVEKQVKVAMKRDKAKVDISRISKFGLMQISRQKLGAPIDAGNYRICEHCKGRGTVRSIETLALFYLRRIQTGASRKQVRLVECHFPLDVAQYLLNKKRHELLDLEKRYETEISIIADPSLKPSDNEIIFHKTEKENLSKKQA
jgi:ribonuclease E